MGNRNQWFQVLAWNIILPLKQKNPSLWKPRDHKVQMTEPQSSNTYPLILTCTRLHLIHLTSEICTLQYLGRSHNLVPKSLTLQILCWHHGASNLCNPWGIKNNGNRYSNTPCESQASEVKWRSIRVWEKAKARQCKDLPRCTSLEDLTKVSQKLFSWPLLEV